MMDQVIKRKYRSPMKLSVVQEEPQGKDQSYFIVSPSQRYFKRVFNKDYLTEKKPNNKKTQQLQAFSSKSFIRSPQFKNYEKYNQIQQPIHEQQKQQSLNNFSMGLFKKPNTDNNSFFDSTSLGERKSQQRRLNFNKIFIVQQNTPFKQVIQLSQRQLQNKQMLQKAVQQLQKRKLKKKFKMLKKQMKLDLSKHKQLDQSIQDLRSHRIGYKTFYRKQVQTQRSNSVQQEKLVSGKAKFNIKGQRRLVTQNMSHYKINELDRNIEIPQSQQVNIFLSDQQTQTRKRNKTNVDITPKQKLNNIQSIPRQKRRKLVSNENQSYKKSHIQLPLLKQSFNDVRSRSSKSRNNFNSNKKHSNSLVQIRKLNTESVKSLTQTFKNIRQLPTINKSSQSLSQNMRYSQKLLRPSVKPSKQITQHSVRTKTQQNAEQPIKNVFNDQFTLLLSKQDLQNTINKSRYEMKKLLCMHIQNRKKQWRKNKSKSFLNQQFIDKQYREMTKSERKFVSDLKPIEETSKQMQNSRYFDQVRSTSAIVPSAPTHLLKLHTKQLKKSIKSFVRKVKAIQSPRKNFKNSPYLQ